MFIKKSLRTVGLTAALALAGAFNWPVSAIAQDEKPNIVFIFMDNFGYGELGA